MDIRKIDKEEVWKLRHEVMWPEREPDYIKLADDDQGVHYGLYQGEQLVSVLSLFINGTEAQFRKFATLELEQGQGYGTRLLKAVLEEAEQAGVRRIFCNARTYKAGFYKKFGMQPTNQVFSKGGKDYVVMEKFLGPAEDDNGGA
ncbi:GNAT family N-acetyltransferase [Paenibacillus piscarius]|uniref:GNAT family N-acetyltransferase n=1 Tax=Paenibacillus piscarius TaxID=1089681 RepID=UPI001EE81975|nr:GNAT family N-acetyltransferase [Paenibacillus piscarius]